MGNENKEDEVEDKSPLGKDEKPVEKETKKEEKVVEVKEEKKLKQLSEEEYAELNRRAANYDKVVNEPELASKIMDHFKAKLGKVGKKEESKEEAPEETKNNDSDERFKALAKRQAAIEVRLFMKENPDAEKYKGEMAQLLNRYSGMSLDEAYRFSKTPKSESDQKPVVKLSLIHI